MIPGLSSFSVFLSIFWFIVYWILGGVFFAVMAILRLGRVRKVRFSCLFTLLAAFCGIFFAHTGVRLASSAIASCSVDATNKMKVVVAVMGCGFSSFLWAFLAGAFVLTLGGFIILTISKTKTKPWIVLDGEEEEEKKEEMPIVEGMDQTEIIQPSKFF